MKFTSPTGRPTVFAKSRPRVLVVDDDAAILRMLERVLRNLGCTAILANSAASAREMIGTCSGLSLAIVDLTLADGDGVSLIDDLTESLGDEAPPFIIFSGGGRPDRLPACVVAVIPKPMAITDLMAAVKEGILKGGAMARARESRPEPRAARSSPVGPRGAIALVRAPVPSLHRFGRGPVFDEVVPGAGRDPRRER